MLTICNFRQYRYSWFDEDIHTLVLVDYYRWQNINARFISPFENIRGLNVIIEVEATRVGVNSGFGIGIGIASHGLGIRIGIERWNWPELKRNCKFHFNSTNNLCYFISLLQYQITNISECLSFVIVSPLEYNTKQCQPHLIYSQ